MRSKNQFKRYIDLMAVTNIDLYRSRNSVLCYIIPLPVHSKIYSFFNLS